jgi:hypothetical protein
MSNYNNNSELVSNQSKFKLNLIWSEVQKNLPSIDFEDDQVLENFKIY